MSDNLAAETLMKTVGYKYSGKTGSIEEGIKAFKEFYNFLGVKPDEIDIYDASGVSHNNMLSVNWMTSALCGLARWDKFNIYRDSLAQPGQDGTLNTRLKDMNGSLWAKTGTLAGVSGITGYIKSKKGKFYSFALLISNFKEENKNPKVLEDIIVREIPNL
jgi:PBP4 family serine-type D-alanyl-D-alanine carboxypeptidase